MKVLRIPESPHTALETAVWTIYAPDSLPSRWQVGSGCAAWLHLPLGSQPSAPIVFSAQPFPESGSDGASLVLVLHMPSWWLLILPIPFFVYRPFINLSSVLFFFMCEHGGQILKWPPQPPFLVFMPVCNALPLRMWQKCWGISPVGVWCYTWHFLLTSVS